MSAESTSDQIEDIKDWLGIGSINFIGMPFAGKDAHAQAIGGILDAPVIGGGQILREQKDKIPPEDVREMEAGGLISSSTYCEMVLDFFSRSEYKDKALMLSAVGRKDGEQQPTIQAAQKSGHPIRSTVVIDISFKEASERWEEASRNGNRGHREDDSYSAFLERFSWFSTYTVPVIESYVEMGLATRVDGRGPREEVTEEILDTLAVLSRQF